MRSDRANEQRWLRKILPHVEKNKWVCKPFLSLKPLNSFHLLNSWTKGRSGNKVVPTGWNGFWRLSVHLSPLQPFKLNRFRASPRYATLVCGLFSAEDNQGPKDSYLKEFTQGAWYKELSPEITYLNDPCAWHGKHLMTPHLLFLSSCESPSSPLKPQVPVSFFSSGRRLPNLPLGLISYGTPVRM